MKKSMQIEVECWVCRGGTYDAALPGKAYPVCKKHLTTMAPPQKNEWEIWKESSPKYRPTQFPTNVELQLFMENIVTWIKNMPRGRE